MSNTMLRAYRNGWHRFDTDGDHTPNPYSVGSLEHDASQAGFHDAKQSDQDKPDSRQYYRWVQRFQNRAISQIRDLTHNNNHSEAYVLLAQILMDKEAEATMLRYYNLQKQQGYLDMDQSDARYETLKPLFEKAKGFPVGGKTLYDLF